MRLPDDDKKFTEVCCDIIEACNSSRGKRCISYDTYSAWIETGRAPSPSDGGLALANMLYAHEDRLQSHLFSPSNLRFTIDFESHQDKASMLKGEMAARVLTREWERKSIDLVFAQSVKDSLDLGAAILKQRVKKGKIPQIDALSVSPRQFGVYDERINSLEDQEAMTETVYLNRHEVWRRVENLPDAEKLYKRIIQHASRDLPAQNRTFAHQILSSSVLDTSNTRVGPFPGGIVQTSSGVQVQDPTSDIDLVEMHELWVKDDSLEDYTTVQIIEPDILIAPRLKRTNLFCPSENPYTLIQPNKVSGYFWGRSEITDLIMLQEWLTTHLDDTKRLVGVQIDKFLGISGDQLTDELYEKAKTAGFLSLAQGTTIQDLTPKMPPETISIIKMILELMDRVSGFENILSGRGESGVRAGAHADTLMKTASPRLKDRALIVERQCGNAASKTFEAMCAKDARAQYPNAAQKDEEAFTLAQISDDWRVMVDSHSSSPIYEENHKDLVGFLLKAGVIDGKTALELLNVPNVDVLVQRLEEQQAQKAAMIAAHPELLMQKGGGHSKPKAA